ncbi:hydantoinase/oxoprolinase family protein [Natrarchaeobius oligotrophus]|uniref:Hydantoinase/oxoprolinase family protein n=1 Tax=Natrarchaeobius chitinivorans TaxID=1679083 RepID=A0A3N6N9P8_NATCH|nr:hydantoinase/oxoprolinase family protein [Natrarchaeobius chitinivorans]RQG95272.1 hydantoinase/oxoprolinase family protein [Natrarchaeobius chitinivorans]
MSYRLGVDVGGTFTDLILFDEDMESMHQTKVASTPEDPSKGVINGIDTLTDEYGISGDEFEQVIHGTTVATNALLEKEGVKTGLITTAGFEDVLQIGRQTRPDLYNFWEHKPDPLVRRRNRVGVTEKISPKGEIIEPIKYDELETVVNQLAENNVDAIAVCLLHSYANSEHEEEIKSYIQSKYPDTTIAVSSEIVPEYREFERMSTTIINAYVQPLMAQYLRQLENKLLNQNIETSLQIMQSNGGIMTAETASEKSAHTLLSGPSAGVLTGKVIGNLTDTENLITFDVGGTSSDICTIHEGEPEDSVENEIGGYPVRIPMLDINTIGAGGGSIAWVDKGGALRVGPKSSGAQPGPVCYGRGGEEPTVTDAHLLLGRLNSDYLLGGELEVDYETAERMMKEKLADPLGMTVEKAAEGVFDVVIANMARGMRVVSVESGYDPREFSLVAFGGAGPLHAYRLIQELDMEKAIIPVTPGVASSLGLLSADTRHDYVTTIVKNIDDLSVDELRTAYNQLKDEAEKRIAAEGIDSPQFSRVADVKYKRQGYELSIPVPNAVFEEGLSMLKDVFAQEHEREYDFSFDNEPIELVNVRLSAISSVETPSLKSDDPQILNPEDAIVGSRDVVFRGETYKTIIYEREKLPPSHQLSGPAILEELSSTTVIGPTQDAYVDEYGNVHITEGNK